MRSKVAVYNIFTNLVLHLIIIIYGFVVPKIIIVNYGSSVNGLISSITQFLTYIALLESGMAPVVKALLYKPIANKNQNEIENILSVSEKFFRRIAKIFVFYIIILLVIYPLIVNKEFNYVFTGSLIVIISVSVFAEYYFGMTYRIYLKAEQKTYVISIIQIIGYILSIIVIIICVQFKTSIQLLKLLSGLMFALKPFLQNHYVKKKYNINLQNSDKNFVIKNKWDGLVQHVAAVIHSNTDIVLLTIFSKLSEVSVYSIYIMVINGVKKIVYIFTSGMEESFGDMIARNEKENLNNKFGLYETLYFTIATIVFTCTLLLIVPFISIYTKGIKDANYARYTFGCLIVAAEYISIIRDPYISLTYAAGHFKETKIGALVECILNITISILLVKKYGLIGVAIGTIAAMTIRAIEFVYHSNKYVLHRNITYSMKKIALVILETLFIVFISKFLPYFDNASYLNWIINATMIGVISSFIVIIINSIFYKKDFCELLHIFKNTLKRRKKNI